MQIRDHFEYKIQKCFYNRTTKYPTCNYYQGFLGYVVHKRYEASFISKALLNYGCEKNDFVTHF